MAHFNHKLSFLTLLLFFLWNTAKADEKTFSTTNGLSTNQRWKCSVSVAALIGPAHQD